MDYYYPAPHDDPDLLSAGISPLGAWRAKAACRDEDSELFFPNGNTGSVLTQIQQTKAVCQQCPVITECLEWALETSQQDGIWGGKSEDDRRALRRNRQRRRRLR